MPSQKQQQQADEALDRMIAKLKKTLHQRGPRAKIRLRQLEIRKRRRRLKGFA